MLFRAAVLLVLLVDLGSRCYRSSWGLLVLTDLLIGCCRSRVAASWLVGSQSFLARFAVLGHFISDSQLLGDFLLH